ncbi:hypothetical protein MUK42_26143 [Musa troglodytarum]|uniref:Uncharacterized protein n=1 Tax=Musa troglodytarum TaxID=320322 RepID=A0A9E7KWX7_9LILI|nr:hypothetical protein MUK42_26143 [Musa troglodytarum]
MPIGGGRLHACLGGEETISEKRAMKGSTTSPSPFFVLHLLLSLLSHDSLLVLASSDEAPLQDINLENPVLEFSSLPYAGHSCQRVRVSGMSRLNFKSYASSVRVALKVSESIPERLGGNIRVCFHWNASTSLCQCEEEKWESLRDNQWSSVISPYDDRYIDVKIIDKISTSLAVSLEEELQQWRLVCLGFGFLLLLMAPTVSNWVPFYYSSSMALGVLLVVLIILFQLGVGSFIAHYFSTIVNSLLVSFGLSEELHNPVSVFIVVGVILSGAALGYWIVRKFVLSEDGTVDSGIAQFVKWAMRFTGVVFILQSTLDVPLALAALAVCWNFTSLINSKKWRQAPVKNRSLWQQKARQAPYNRHAEFLSPISKKEPGRAFWGSSSPYSLSLSPYQGKSYSSSRQGRQQNKDYYSTYHNLPVRKFSKKDWDNFTRESTNTALTEWASTPEVAKWIAENAHRMRLDQGSSSGDTMESSSGSSEETVVENGSGLSFFKWL